MPGVGICLDVVEALDVLFHHASVPVLVARVNAVVVHAHGQTVLFARLVPEGNPVDGSFGEDAFAAHFLYELAGSVDFGFGTRMGYAETYELKIGVLEKFFHVGALLGVHFRPDLYVGILRAELLSGVAFYAVEIQRRELLYGVFKRKAV